MSALELVSYYVGHGSMYYVEVRNDASETVLHLIVDAGTNPRAANPAMVMSNLGSIVARIASRPAQVIVCLTHFHLDHYSHMAHLLDGIASLGPAVPYLIYLTASPKCFNLRSAGWRHSLFEELYDPLGSMSEEVVFRDIVMRHGKNLRLLDAYQNGLENLWAFPPAISLDRLFSWTDVTNDENRNGTLFALRVDGSLIWFTGDITGTTMEWLIGNDILPQAGRDIRELVNGAQNIAMTVPHHGSIHTLEESYFIYADPLLKKHSPLTTEDFNKFFKLLCGDRFNHAFVSADFEDRYKHPDAWTLYWLMELQSDSSVAHVSVGYKHVAGNYMTIADTKLYPPVRYFDIFTRYKNLYVTWHFAENANAAIVVYDNPAVVM